MSFGWFFKHAWLASFSISTVAHDGPARYEQLIMQSDNYDNQAIEHPAQNGVSFMLQ